MNSRRIITALLMAAAAALIHSPARAQDEGGLNVALMGEIGWRWVALGQDSIPRQPDMFQNAYHAAVRMDIGGSSGGLYTYARFDGYAPTFLDTFPWQAQFRMGWFTNVHYFDAGGPRQSTSTSYTGTECYGYNCYDEYTTTTTNWWEPAGWVNGLRYLYAGGRLVSGTRVATGSTDTQYAAAAAIGAGIVEHKFTTWFAETEIQFYPSPQWQETERSEWGWWLRLGALFGPVFIDFTLLLDPAIGGELGIGLGVMLGG